MESSSEAPSALDLQKFSAKEIGIPKHLKPSCHEIEDGSRNLDFFHPENSCRKLADTYEGVNSLSEDDLIKLEKDKNSSLLMVKFKLGTSAHSETIASGTSSVSTSEFPLSSNMPKRSKSSNQSTQTTRCQVEGCNLDLASAKDYHRRHRICEAHSKSPKVIVAGLERRFCQQCSRFHSLSEFDDMKRSCRRRLSDHNARRRRPHPETIHFSSSGFSSSIYDGRLQNFLLNKTPTSASNATWGSFCSFKMGEAGNPLISPLARTDRKLHLPQKHRLNTGKNTSAASSDLDEARVFPRALSLLSISSCTLSGTEPCSFEQNMQGYIGITRPVMQIESQSWPIISSHLPEEQVASTSSMNAMDFHSTDDSSQFQNFLSFKTSYEPNFYNSS